MGGDSKSGNGGQTNNYYGSGGGVVCAGPVDELIAVIVDGKTVWPTGAGGSLLWNAGINDIKPTQRCKAGIYVTGGAGLRYWLGCYWIDFPDPTGLEVGDKVITSGFGDEDWNGTSTVGAPLSVNPACNVGPVYGWIPGGWHGNPVAITHIYPTQQWVSTPWVADAGGRLDKSTYYAAGNVCWHAGEYWACILAHWSDPSKAPPNGTYWTRWGIKRSEEANPYVFTVPGLGDAEFYWGTDDQELADGSVLYAHSHPPYRRQALFTMRKWLLGTERAALPNVEIVVRRYPQQSLVINSSADLVNGQANPIATLAHLVTDPVFGLGRTNATFDATTCRAVADALATAPGLTYQSPILNETSTMREFVASLLSYYDGWLRWAGDGTIKAGRWLHNEAPPAFTEANAIRDADLVEEIQFTADGWAKTYTETVTRFTDAARAWKDAARKVVSIWNRNIVGESRKAILDRPWITNEDQAAAYAAEWQKVNAVPKISGQLVVRAEKGVNAGDVFLLVHDTLGLNLVCRCTGRTEAPPPVGRATLTFENERGIAPLTTLQAAVAPQSIRVERSVPSMLYEVLQLPAALAGGDEYGVGVLVARSTYTSVGYRVHMKEADGSLYYQVGESAGWAVLGTLTQNWDAAAAPPNYPTDDNTEDLQCDILNGLPTSDVDAVTATQTEDAVANGDVLAVVVHVEDGVTTFEVCAVRSLRADAGVYKLRVRRAQFGTGQFSFVTGDRIWICRREALTVATHRRFPVYAQAGTTATFKIQSYTALDEADLSDDTATPPIEFVFADPNLPGLEWSYQWLDGVTIPSEATINDTTGQFEFGLKAFDTNGLTELKVIARQGSDVRTLWAQSFAPCRSQYRSVRFQLTEGVWRVFAVATNIGGRTAVIEAAHRIQMQPSGVSRCMPPYPDADGAFTKTSVSVTLACSTDSADIHYNPSQYGESPSSSWGVYSGAIPLTLGAGNARAFTLFLTASKTGLEDSIPVRYDFWYEPPEQAPAGGNIGG